ncbi:MAG: hypothetical protein ACW97X_09345 [Candidatus Hodarchaeales archaeon]|jgi:hypothetical protein
MISIEFAEFSIFQLFSIGFFGYFFGVFEASTNLFYLISKNQTLPRKQHSSELPSNATDAQVFHKVVQMLILGLVLLFLSLISSIIAPQLFTIGAALILINGLIDYSKFRKGRMMLIWTFIAILTCIFSLIPIA